MAKNIMISNEAYEKLKNKKELEGSDKSYSDIVLDLLENREKRKTLPGLRKHFGILKNDKEYDKIMKDLKKEWAKWMKKYV